MKAEISAVVCWRSLLTSVNGARHPISLTGDNPLLLLLLLLLLLDLLPHIPPPWRDVVGCIKREKLPEHDAKRAKEGEGGKEGVIERRSERKKKRAKEKSERSRERGRAKEQGRERKKERESDRARERKRERESDRARDVFCCWYIFS